MWMDNGAGFDPVCMDDDAVAPASEANTDGVALYGEYEGHPAANMLPLLGAEDLAALAADIEANGQHEPIVLIRVGKKKQILDGRNRMRACLLAKKKPVTCLYEGDDPIGYVLSRNVKRRHLSAAQKTAIAVEALPLYEAQARERMAEGGRSKGMASLPDPGSARDAAATSVGVAERYVSDGKRIREASENLHQALKAGKLTVPAAKKIAALAEPIRSAAVKYVWAGRSGAEAYRQAKADTIAKAELEKPSGKYRVIYADPPWSYGNSMPPGTGVPTDHYPAMELKEICALPVNDLALDDSVLFIWTTSPHLEEAFEVIGAWGFSYKTSFVWDKIKHNMGHYNSVRHELLLVCTRGSCQPDERKLFDSVYSEERTEHSRKPDYFYKVIETIYPKGERVELFARRPRDGWKKWGYEAG